MTSLGKLESLDASCIPECSKVMAKAFSDSPSYNYIFQGTQEYREKALEWLFEKNLELMMTKCPSSVLRGVRNSQGEVVCCFLWLPSQYAQLSMWEMVTAGMWQVPFRFGLSTLKRLVALLDSMEAATGKVSDENDTATTTTSSSLKQNYIMLERMVVRPDHQGQSVGSHALRAILQQEEESSQNSSSDVHLETQEERNVRFYQRLGWEVVYDRDYCEDDPDYKFHSWHMVRKA
jgi:GNAT superfamily N-acetyltransferase